MQLLVCIPFPHHIFKVSRIGALYGIKCDVSHTKVPAKSFVYILPYAPRWAEPHCRFPWSNVTQGRLLDSYKFIWTRRDCCCAPLLKVLKTPATLRGCGKGVSAWSSLRWGNRKYQAKIKNVSKSGLCLRELVELQGATQVLSLVYTRVSNGLPSPPCQSPSAGRGTMHRWHLVSMWVGSEVPGKACASSIAGKKSCGQQTYWSPYDLLDEISFAEMVHNYSRAKYVPAQVLSFQAMTEFYYSGDCDVNINAIFSAPVMFQSS